MQVTPSPVYSAMQVQVKLPNVLAQSAFTLQLSVPLPHSLMSENNNDVPLKARNCSSHHQHLHVDVLQSVWNTNSSIIPLQVKPSPSKPMAHAQEKLPNVSVHTEFGPQLSVPRAHSLISVHTNMYS